MRCPVSCPGLPGLGHGTSGPSHGSVSVSLPWQLIATPGNRWHLRRRRLLPPGPHVIEHGPRSDQHDHWPTHGCSLHGRESCPGPAQSRPVPDGTGVEQVRWRHCVPPAQDALQTVHVVHDDQPPSTSDTLDPPAVNIATITRLLTITIVKKLHSLKRFVRMTVAASHN